MGPGVKDYRGQIIGEHCRENDLTVNPAKGKQSFLMCVPRARLKRNINSTGADEPGGLHRLY